MLETWFGYSSSGLANQTLIIQIQLVQSAFLVSSCFGSCQQTKVDRPKETLNILVVAQCIHIGCICVLK
jgi:hypothetical protein